MDPRELYQLVVGAQGTLPPFKENMRAGSLLDGMRRKLQVAEEPFSYSITFNNLDPTEVAGAASQSGLIDIQADADFKLLATMYEADADGTPQTHDTRVVPNINVLLTDQGNGRNLMDQAMPVPSVFGTAQLPYLWASPKILTARSRLQVQVTTFEASVNLDLRLVFNGVKLYPM